MIWVALSATVALIGGLVLWEWRRKQRDYMVGKLLVWDFTSVNHRMSVSDGQRRFRWVNGAYWEGMTPVDVYIKYGPLKVGPKTANGLAYPPIRRIVVTHGHGNHTASLIAHELEHIRLYDMTGDPDYAHNGPSWKQIDAPL